MKGSRGARGNPADRAALIKSVCMSVGPMEGRATEEDAEEPQKLSDFNGSLCSHR